MALAWGITGHLFSDNRWEIPVATAAIWALAGSNAAGRILWGVLVDRVGSRPAMIATQAVLLAMQRGLVHVEKEGKINFVRLVDELRDMGA